MVAARIMGGTGERLLRVTDPLERLTERLVIDRAFDRWLKVQEAQTHRLANEIAKRFGGK